MLSNAKYVLKTMKRTFTFYHKNKSKCIIGQRIQIVDFPLRVGNDQAHGFIYHLENSPDRVKSINARGWIINAVSNTNEN
jgi:hypothetical protein